MLKEKSAQWNCKPCITTLKHWPKHNTQWQLCLRDHFLTLAWQQHCLTDVVCLNCQLHTLLSLCCWFCLHLCIPVHTYSLCVKGFIYCILLTSWKSNHCVQSWLHCDKSVIMVPRLEVIQTFCVGVAANAKYFSIWFYRQICIKIQINCKLWLY